MKKLFILVLTMIFAITAQSQHLTAVDLLEKVSCRNLECYMNFVQNKGFSFKKSTVESNKQTYYLFVSNQLFEATSNNSVKASNNTSISYKLDGEIASVGIWTVDKEYFQKMLSEFIDNGFKEFITLPLPDGGTELKYSSSKYAGIILSVIIQGHLYQGESYVSYNFSVIK